jgi:hypothetical protein
MRGGQPSYPPMDAESLDVLYLKFRGTLKLPTAERTDSIQPTEQA